MKQTNINIEETWLKVLGKGMITLPKKWRDDMGVTTGDVIKAKKEGRRVVIETSQTESGNLLKSMAGVLKDTKLNNDNIWKKALKKKSRASSITS